MNIALEYLYRDYGNYKKWGVVVFSNPNNLPLKTISSMIQNCFMDDLYFSANKLGIPSLHFDDFDEELDHCWHEFHRFFPTEEKPDDPQNRTIEEFIEFLNIGAIF